MNTSRLQLVDNVAVAASLLATGVLWNLEATTSAVLLGVLHVVFAVYVFLRHGGPRVTATGVFFLSSAIFVGVALLYLVRVEARYLLGNAATLAATSHLVNAAIFWLFCRSTADAPAPPPLVLPTFVDTSLVAGGLLMSLTALAARRSLGPLADAMAYNGALLVALGSLCSSRLRGIVGRSLAWGIACASTLAFVMVAFHGHGRLIVASLGICVLIAGAATSVSGFKWKLTVLALAFPALVIGGVSRQALRQGTDPRVARLDSSAAQDAANAGEGLGSLYSPLRDYAWLVSLDESGSPRRFPRQNGRTFYEALVAPVPRELWNDKPIGLGRRLAEHLAPEVRNKGHSLAATWYAEWFINFGWWGLVACVPFIGFALSWLDRALFRVASQGIGSLEQALKFACICVLAGGVVDYFWVGAFTFHARAGIRVYVLVGVSLCLVALRMLARQLPGNVRSHSP